jgi:hypothetical protein
MARTTLDLDGTVLRELRERGRQEGKSMGQVASELLAPALADEESPRERSPLRWVSKRMGTPRIDLEDKHALGQALDEEYLQRLAR